MAAKLIISNRKGGVGKTTVAVNLAAELAALGQQVLLIDLDSQNHCSVGLGVKTVKGAPTIHDIFRHGDARLADAIQATAYPGLSLAPADPLFEHGSGLRDEGLLTRALAAPEIAASFDTIIIDTPPSLDILLLNALNAANWVLIPYVPHVLSFEGVRQLTRVLFKIMSGSNQQLKIAGFLPMMAAEHIRQHRIISSEITQQFGAHRVLPPIRSDIRLVEAFSAGKPIRDFAPKSRGAEDFAVLGSCLKMMHGQRRKAV